MSTAGADDFATRGDLRDLGTDLKLEMREFRGEICDIRNEQRDSTRMLLFSMLASQTTLVGMVLAAVKLA